MLDVAVIGAGPAGLYTALLLAEEGFDVAVLEEHGEIGTPTHCTGVVSDEISDLFKVPESLVLNRPTDCAIVSPAGHTVWLRAADEGIAVLDRGQFDAELGAEALRAGAEIRTGTRVERVSAEPRRVRVTASEGAAVQARVCVLACGVSYGFQRDLGLGLPSLFLHSAQVEVDAEAARAVELHPGAAIAPEGFAWLVPVVRDGRPRLKVGLMTRGDAGAHLSRFMARGDIARRLSAPPGRAIRRLLPLGPISRTFAHRVIAVGDAAGLTKPTTGGGIFYSLLSGALAAETLAEALRRDELGARQLRAYEGRWRARLDSHLRVSSYARRLFAKLGDAEIEVLLQALASDDLQRVIRRTGHFNWQGEALRSMLRQHGVKSVLTRALLR
jgi:geranylgeranyl reductase family protein